MVSLLQNEGILLYLSEIHADTPYYTLYLFIFIVVLFLTLLLNFNITKNFHNMLRERLINENRNNQEESFTEVDEGLNNERKQVKIVREYLRLLKGNILNILGLVVLLYISDLLFSTFVYIILLFTQSLYILLLIIYFMLFNQLGIGKFQKRLKVKGIDIIIMILYIYLIQGIETMVYIFNRVLMSKLLILFGFSFD